MQEFIDSELFRQWFYGALMLFYGVVLIWLMWTTYFNKNANK